MPKNAEEVVEIIFEYITKIQPLREYEEILMQLADMGRHLAKADRCTVWVVDRSAGHLWTKVAHGIDTIRIPLGSGIVGDAINQKTQSIINDVRENEHFNAEIDRQTGYETHNMMVIPMFNSQNIIIGAFQVINKLEGDFDETDLKYLSLAASYAAETLDAAILAEENDQTQKEMIFLMSEAVEKRSKETGNHIKRVASYSKTLALAYGLSEEEAYVLEFASPMHDIGKIGIPDAILNKPGRLSEDEFVIMKQHAALGYEILSASPRGMLKAAATVAYEHHEKWDGSGYPQALKGDEINIYGRITAVADVFDALGSDRCYKKAWPLEDVLEFFKEQKGRHFDPKLVDLLFENLDTFLEIRDKYKDEVQ
jgi:response regulator RpfG family c-di-GMP phosphodiesterase